MKLDLLVTDLPPKTAGAIVRLAQIRGKVQRAFVDPEPSDQPPRAPFPSQERAVQTAAAPIGDEDVQGSDAYRAGGGQGA